MGLTAFWTKHKTPGSFHGSFWLSNTYQGVDEEELLMRRFVFKSQLDEASAI